MAQRDPCPACRGTNVEVIKAWRMGKGRYAAACRECGLLFVHPQPAQAQLDAYYAPDGGWQATREEKPQPAATRTKGAAAATFAALDRHFTASAPAPGARVFDFGCGLGLWLNSFQDRGWDTYGLEPAGTHAFARHTRLDEIPAEPRFDLVIVYHVFEHLPRPLHTMEQLAAAMVPGGFLFGSVPRLETLAAHRETTYCLHRDHHIAGYTETCMRGLLARAGLEMMATFHELDGAFTGGVPLRMRFLARKTGGDLALPADPAAALTPVIEAFVDLRTQAKLAASGQ